MDNSADVKKAGSKLHVEKWKIFAVILMIYDMAAVTVSYFAALMLRYDMKFRTIPVPFISSFLRFAPFYALACVVVFTVFRMYATVWQYASYYELLRAVLASVIMAVSHIFLIIPFCRYFGIWRLPISYYFFGACFQGASVVGVRFVYRVLMLFRNNSEVASSDGPRIMIIGAGDAGQKLLREINTSKTISGKVCCIIDDDKNKIGRFIDGIKIVGDRNDILHYRKKYGIDKIFVAIPSLPPDQIKQLLEICKEAGCEIKTLPSAFQLVDDRHLTTQMKNVSIEDLLGREPIKVEMDEIFEYISGKKILITGGGGSIGSELARQIAAHSPELLLIFDVYENNAYEIQQELKRKYPDLNLAVEIGSVRDSRRLDQLFEKYKPDIVYHAAAHKHVPLMEDSPNEAIKNNVFGTYKTAYAAMMNGVHRFVLISTDKAVNPTNIMGASKRLCEMIIQFFDRMIKEHRENEIPVLRTHMEDDADKNTPFIIPGQDDLGHTHAQTEFVAVRFGNVLGSNGSVIPLFKKQIETTRVITVTDKRIIRYFMTIPEAVSLVLQAGTYAKGGEIFVLDMGEPVKIDTLARNLIKLSGLRPDIDVKIEYTGLRPGEKLFEEKLMDEEGLQTTPNKLIHIGSPIPFDMEKFIGNLTSLLNTAFDNSDDIFDQVASMVPTYQPDKRNR